MKKYKYTLSKNDIPIYHLRNDTSYLSHIIFWFNIGSRYEQKNYYGMIHLIEHLLLSCHYSNENQLRDILNEKGIEFKLSTSYEYFYLLLSCKEEDVEEIIKIVFSVLSNPNIDNISFVNEKKTVMLEKKSRTFIDQKNIQDIITENIWDEDLSHPILGTELTLSKIKLNQILDVIKYLNNSKNFSILYSGKKYIDDFSEIIDKHYEVPSEEEELRINSLIRDTIEPSAFKETDVMLKTKEDSDKSASSFVSICYEFDNGLSKDEKIYLSLFSIMMTMNDTGLLYEEFRLKEQSVYFIVCLPIHFKYESILQVQFITEQSDLESLILHINEKVNTDSKEINIMSKYFEKSKKFLQHKIYKILENDKDFLLFLGNERVSGRHQISLDEMLRILDSINIKDMQAFINENLNHAKMKRIILS
ncbi:M16 family metallopeptidase [Lysinibacillus sp. NPDC093692]|uniref:M16 family metallopeptidase n=1 Tax=Lysinibacillus sp. NPDC093692 TaxID=3390578 RepID=UPI003D091DD2